MLKRKWKKVDRIIDSRIILNVDKRVPTRFNVEGRVPARPFLNALPEPIYIRLYTFIYGWKLFLIEPPKSEAIDNFMK